LCVYVREGGSREEEEEEEEAGGVGFIRLL